MGKRQGIKMEYEEIKILQEEHIGSNEETDSPAFLMGINLHEIRKGGENEVKSKITGKLREYLERNYPEKYQQIHAHVMSLKAWALVGVLFTPGLLEDEIGTIVGKKGTDNDNEARGQETNDKEDVQKTMLKTYGEDGNKGMND